MLRFYAATYGDFMSKLAHVAHLLKQEPKPDEWRAIFINVVEAIETNVKNLPVERVVRKQFDDLRQRAETHDAESLSLLLEVLSSSITADLEGHCYLAIEAEKRMFFEQKEPPFGSNVEQFFPGSNHDVSAASKCFALDQWTATVLHLMRALEPALMWLGKEVGLKQEDLKHKNWQIVIDQIEKEIRELGKKPKTDRARVRLLNEAASQFRYFKDAWRNYAAHGHATYDESSATAIWVHVRDFMMFLGDWIASPQTSAPCAAE